MLNTIKFRGKRLDNGAWISGDGIHQPKSPNWIGSCWIDGGEPRANDWVQVDPKTVSEWTGMRDISGTEIYDGDIVRDRNDVIYEVKRLCASFELFPKRKNAVHGYRPTILDNSLGLTIIGNIYDGEEAAT